ncbi:MAG: aspartate carbamoyltransferase catalytic subunit [Actinobacteria bacterium]|nr:aspartate carbamoyltransferase catalytic subunit [Actinomycetota bacterium]
MKTFLGVRGMHGSEIQALAEMAATMGDRLDHRLRGHAVALLFFEPSTRTRLSFELATRRLGGWPVVFGPEGSSMEKGETIRDTVTTVSALGVEILVIRSSEAGIPEAAHGWTGRAVVNAGDGANEHPTQALADVVTLIDHFGEVGGLEVAIVGDVAHSRVAGSLCHALPALGAGLRLVGPPDLLGEHTGLPTTEELDEVIDEVDVVYLLRVQRERGAVIDPGYIDRYRLGADRARRMRPGAVVMHPGPMNRGVEITDEVAEGPRSLILRQVANGVPARMAVLATLAEGLG